MSVKCHIDIVHADNAAIFTRAALCLELCGDTSDLIHGKSRHYFEIKKNWD